MSARAAVEDDADEIRHWHLLGLLLSANGEWEKAASVLEVGAELDERKQDMEVQLDSTRKILPMTLW